MAFSEMHKEQIFKACRHFMKPIIRFLLRNRITWDEFSELSKDVFVNVAREDYGIQQRPTNNSRVAMMTGLSDAELPQFALNLLSVTAGNIIGGSAFVAIVYWLVYSQPKES